MRELKDGGGWQQRNEWIAEISPSHYYTSAKFRPRKKSDLRAGMVLSAVKGASRPGN